MAVVKKFTIGVMPFAKMFRVLGLAGEAMDAVLRLRSKTLPDDYFVEAGTNSDRTKFRLSSADQLSALHITQDSITFVKDYYEADVVFDFRKVLEEFRVIWAAVNGVLKVQDVRRIGMVGEYRFTVGTETTSGWLRKRLTTLETSKLTEKFTLRFEEREMASDGKAPDPKKSDFYNYIYNYYDSAIDDTHPNPGFVQADLDVQRYYAPVFNGNVGDEVLKLHKHFELAQKRLIDHLKSLGAVHGAR